MRGVDYNTLYPPNLNPIPPEKFLKIWEADYKTMQTHMIPEESPSFAKLLQIVKQAAKEYNTLNIK